MFELAREPAEVGRLIDDGIRLFRTSIGRVFLLSLAAAFVMYLPEFAVRLLPEPVAETWTPGLAVILLLLVGALLLVLLYFTLYNAIVIKTWNCATCQSTDDAEILRRGFILILPVILASILYGLAVLIGTILLIIPGIYLSVALSLYIFPIVAEGLGPIATLQRTFRLIRGNWWRTLLILIIPTIIVVVLFTVVGIVAGILAFILTGFTSEGQAFEILIEVIMNVAQAVSVPFYISIMAVLYNDLRLRLDTPTLTPTATADSPADTTK